MPLKYTVQQGDCISSIAFAYGFWPDTIWEHPDNSELRAKRNNPHVLFPGDVVVVPDKRETARKKPADARHRFRRKGVPSLLRLQLLENGLPREKLPYTLDVAGRVSRGVTDTEGRLVEWISPAAFEGKLVITDSEQYSLQIGHIDPAVEPSGALDRLVNLGFLRSEQDDEATLAAAVEGFQKFYRLNVTGRLDPPTLAKLDALHGY